jgi:hypothetical protein
MLFILYVDDSPFVFPASYGLAVYDDVALTSYYCEGNEGLCAWTWTNERVSE